MRTQKTKKLRRNCADYAAPNTHQFYGAIGRIPLEYDVGTDNYQYPCVSFAWIRHQSRTYLVRAAFSTIVSRIRYFHTFFGTFDQAKHFAHRYLCITELPRKRWYAALLHLRRLNRVLETWGGGEPFLMDGALVRHYDHTIIDGLGFTFGYYSRLPATRVTDSHAHIGHLSCAGGWPREGTFAVSLHGLMRQVLRADKTNAEKAKKKIQIRNKTIFFCKVDPLERRQDFLWDAGPRRLKQLSLKQRQALAGYFDVRLDTLAVLQQDSHPAMMAAVASNPLLPPEKILFYAQHASAQVRIGVAQNPNTPVEVLSALQKDPSAGVRLALIQNPRISAPIVAALLQDQHTTVKNTAIRKAPFSEAELFALEQRITVPECVPFAMRRDLPLVLQEKLARHTDQRVRFALVRNPTLDTSILQFLQSDADDQISRYAALRIHIKL